MARAVMDYISYKLLGREVGAVSMEKLLRRIEDCKIPTDKVQILDHMDLLVEKLGKDSERSIEGMVAHKGMGLVFKLLKEFQEKPDVVFMCISVISLCVKCGPLVLELVKLGGILLLNDIVKHHPKDSYIQAVVPDLIKQLRVAGTQQAVHEIHMESMTLEFCTHCQEVAQRAKDKEEGVDVRARLSEPNNFKGAIVPSGCNRINKATYFMKEYADVDTVQIAGLDAIIIFARSGDAKEAIDDTTAIETAVVALDNFPANESIVWRVALLLSTLARLKVTYAMEIVTDNVHNTLARDFQRYRVAPYVQQQILWLFGNLLIWPRVRLEIQRTESCMVLFNAFDYRPKPTIEMEHMSKIELEMLKSGGRVSVLYQVVLPLKLREFMRATDGKLLVVEEEKVVTQDERSKDLSKKRSKLEKKPRFGTVGSKYFIPGQQGLLDGDPAKWSQGDILPPLDAAKKVFGDPLASKSEPNSPEKPDRAAMPLSSRTP